MDGEMKQDSVGKSTPAAKYKGMKQQQPLLVEKKDGSIAPWGNDLKSKTKTPAQIEAEKAINQATGKKQMGLSDKAKGLSNNYY